MNTNELLQSFSSSVITLMLAKFILNDVPHAAGLTGASALSWVQDAWDELSTAVSWSGGDLELMMSDAVKDDGLDQKSIDGYKMLLGGYYLVATGNASDRIVNDLYDHMSKGVEWGKETASLGEGMDFDTALRFYRKEYGVPEDREPVMPSEDMGWLGVLEGIAYVDKLFKGGDSRSDKIIAIDSAMYVIHATEGILQFITPLMWGQGIAMLIAAVLGWLRAGTNTRFPEHVEGGGKHGWEHELQQGLG